VYPIGTKASAEIYEAQAGKKEVNEKDGDLGVWTFVPTPSL
jgi:hypothetical protein